MKPAELFVEANQLRHRVLEWDGRGSTTVLCLHGFLDLSWGFAPVAPALAAAGYHVIAPDLRGHGLTERVGRGGYYHFMDYVFDVTDLADALGRERLVLVGHSMGGMIAALWAGTFPDRLEKLAMLEGLGATELQLEDLPRRTSDWVATVRRARQRELRAYATLQEAADRLREHDPLCPGETALFLAEKGTREVPGGRSFLHDPVHLTRGPYGFRLEQASTFWERIRCPVLLVDGARTDLVVPGLEERRAHFRTARRVEIADAGHMMMRHQPGAVARELLAFLAS